MESLGRKQRLLTKAPGSLFTLNKYHSCSEPRFPNLKIGINQIVFQFWRLTGEQHWTKIIDVYKVWVKDKQTGETTEGEKQQLGWRIHADRLKTWCQKSSCTVRQVEKVCKERWCTATPAAEVLEKMGKSLMHTELLSQEKKSGRKRTGLATAELTALP